MQRSLHRNSFLFHNTASTGRTHFSETERPEKLPSRCPDVEDRDRSDLTTRRESAQPLTLKSTRKPRHHALRLQAF